MADLIKTLSGNLWKFVYAWLLPAIVAISAFVLFVFPAIVDLSVVRQLTKAASQNVVIRSITFVVAALIVAVLLALNSTPLYRLLEGYNWPRWAYEARKRTQVRRWKRVKAIAFAPPGSRVDLIQQQLAWDRLKEYPDEQYILPTRLGNAIKAFETYGVSRYGLDSQTFWYELVTVAPDALQKEEQDARAVVDFFVSAIYLAALFSAIAVLVSILRSDMQSLAAGAIAAMLVPFFYSRAVKSVRQWRFVVQALVNVGRLKLADALGLTLPPTLEEERQMWQALTGFVFWGSEEYAKDLERFRSTAADGAQDNKGNSN